MYQSCMPVSELYLEIILPSSLHSVYDVELLAEDNAKETELPGFTDELLFEPVEELDFSELLDLAEDFPLVEDFSELLEAELLVEISPADSGATPEEDSSSPQAVKDIVMANSAKARNLHTFIRSSSMQKSVIAYTQQSRP